MYFSSNTSECLLLNRIMICCGRCSMILNRVSFFSEYSHSSTEANQDSKQNYATPSFRELHKVQRQVLQPAPAYVTDQSSATGASTANLSKMTQENAYEDSLHARHSFSAGSQSQSRSKTQVFLPGENVSYYFL